MSGIGAPGRAPRTDAELALQVNKRVRRLENPQAVRVGPYSITVKDNRLVVLRNDGNDAFQPVVIDDSGNPVTDGSGASQRGQFRALEAVLESQGVSTADEPDTIKSTFEKILNQTSPLDSYKLNGSPPKGFYDLIPVSAIGAADTNMAANPHFVGPESVLGLDEWTWDGEVTHSPETIIGAGSARTELTGAARELGSNPISAVAGQRIPMQMYTTWESVTLSEAGAFITLIAQGYQEGALVHDQVLATAGYVGSSPDWAELRGEYTVPAEVDDTALVIDEVRMLLRIETNGSGGTVWISDAWLSKNMAQGVFPFDSVDRLPESLDILDEAGQMTIAVIIKVLTGLPGVGWLFHDLEEEFANFFDDSQVTAGRADDAWSDSRTLIGHIISSVFGPDNQYDTGDPTGAREALDNVVRSLTKNTRTLQEMQARDAGELASGKVIDIDFSDYPDGTLPVVFSVRYTGPGTSLLVIKKGKVQWDKLNNQNRDAWVIYNEPTATNFQLLRGTMSSPPEDTTDGGRPHFYALGRVSSPAAELADGGISSVFVRAWSLGSFFQYRGDIGCIKNGVEYVWVSGITLTWSLDMTYVVGVGNDERQYQVFSGMTLVYTYTETVGQPGGLSKLALDTFDVDGVRIVDDRYRTWGSLAQLRRNDGGSPHAGGIVAGCSVADNELPAVVGSTATMYRTNTTNVLMIGGDVVTALPSNFFEFVGRASRDIKTNTGNGSLTVTNTGNYLIKVRIELAVGMNSRAYVILLVNGVEVDRSAGITPSNGEDLSETFMHQLEADDVVRIAYAKAGGNLGNLTGDATGNRTYVSITKMEPA